MARARNIKPGFFKNEDLAECSPWARLCFAGLWTLADRDGRLEDRPKRIKGELFPYDTIDVEPLLQELERFNFIIRYEIDGFKAIQILEFSKHQSPHYSENKSVIKPPELPEFQSHDESGNPDNSRKEKVIKRGSQPPDSLIPDSLIPDSTPSAPSEKISLGAGGWEGIPDRLMTAWGEAYPAVSVPAELAKAAAWIIANPKNRKSNYARFLTNWLTRAQDNAGRFNGPAASGGANARFAN